MLDFDRSIGCVKKDMGAEGDSSSEPKTKGSGGDSGGEGGEEVVGVNVRCSNGSKFTVRTTLESTVEAFKALLAQNCDVPADQQRLIYKGRILKDDQTLQSYGKACSFSEKPAVGCLLGSRSMWILWILLLLF